MSLCAMLALHVPVMTRRGNGDLKHCVNSVNWGVSCQLPAVFQKLGFFFFLNIIICYRDGPGNWRLGTLILLTAMGYPSGTES